MQDLFASLPEDVIYQLALIMYLGRGDFGTEDLAGHYQALKERFGQADWASEEMMGKATLGVYLMDGLAELKKSGLDVDHLTVPSVSSGS